MQRKDVIGHSMPTGGSFVAQSREPSQALLLARDGVNVRSGNSISRNVAPDLDS